MSTIQKFTSELSFQDEVDKAEVTFPLIGIVEDKTIISTGHAVDKSVNPHLMQKLYNAGLAENKNYMTFEEAENVTISQIPTFKNDTSLTSFIELKYFTKIKNLSVNDYFQGCTNLVEIDLRNITSVVRNMFYGCSKLKNVYNSGKMSFNTYGVFSNCSKIEEIQLPNGWTSTVNSSFLNCSKLKKVYTSKGYLGSVSVFEGCSSLESLHFSRQGNANYSSVAGSIFKDCSSLKYIIIESYMPPIGFTSATFSNIGAENLYIFVPDEALEVYETTWDGLYEGYATLKGLSEFYTLFPNADEKFYWIDVVDA